MTQPLRVRSLISERKRITSVEFVITQNSAQSSHKYPIYELLYFTRCQICTDFDLFSLFWQFKEGRSVLVREDRENSNRRNPPYMGGRGGYGGGPPGGGYGGGGRGAYRQVYGNGASGGGGHGPGNGGNYQERVHDRYHGGYDKGDRGDKGNHGGRYRSRSRSPRR